MYFNFFPALPTQPASLAPAATYYATTADGAPASPTKYHENGHDTFSDFVTLVCQEANQPVPGAPERSTAGKVPSYFSTSMYPPPPPAPMARPVAIIRSAADLHDGVPSSSPSPQPPPAIASSMPSQRAAHSPLALSVVSTAGGSSTICVPANSADAANILRLSPPAGSDAGSLEPPPKTVVSLAKVFVSHVLV